MAKRLLTMEDPLLQSWFQMKRDSLCCETVTRRQRQSRHSWTLICCSGLEYKTLGLYQPAGPDELRKRVQELTFIGLQIQLEADGAVKLHQKRWVLSELHQRNWTHLRGPQGLPQVEFVGTENPESPDYAAALKKAQTELGCLLWVATKSRGGSPVCCVNSSLSSAQVPDASLEDRPWLLAISWRDPGHWSML